jgi:hypothetical protein
VPDIIDRAIRAGELPPQLRGEFDADATVFVSVRRVTENGFTADFEAGVLAAEQETESVPFRPAAEVMRELKSILDES